jgi:hypothetical protein
VRALLLIALLATSSAASAQDEGARSTPIELASGASALLVLGPLSGKTSMALDVIATGPIVRAWWWSGGARLGLGPLGPEVFARVLARPRVRAWEPALGLELGLSARGDDDSGGALIAESRAVSREGLSPFYLAVHAAPLRFHLSERFRLSLLELDLGTHLEPLGRFVRAQLGFVSLGYAL